MKLNENILKLRKEKGYSQEQLGEFVNVTQQTISNWELGETAPNPEQLKQLSKVFSVSVDELLDNDIKHILEKKISNTEKLAGMIIKILKVAGILFALLIVLIIAFIFIFGIRKTGTEVYESGVQNVEMQCSFGNKEYLINVGEDGYFNCSNCSIELQKKLYDEVIDFSDMRKTEENVKQYFNNHKGNCK